ncbi:MAG: amino acid ABC transporter permease [Erysipelotrichaceae bacterium]|nr:amino acid ABC transporter permease [Erysipelotrichaceae bacterium]
MKIINLLTDSFLKILLPGIKVTIPLTIISFSLAMIIGIITAMIQFADIKGLKQLARFYIWVIRGTPLLIQLFVVFYGLPSVGVIINPFPAAVLVFSINEGAYSAETIRGALEAVPKGQIEAGYCSGLNFIQIMWHIVLPQALRMAFPSLANGLIAMVKSTSLAANITVMEMFMVTQQIVARTYEALALYLELAFIYLMFSTVLTRLQTYIEERLNARGDRR